MLCPYCTASETKVTDKRSWDAIKVARLYSEDKATKAEWAAAGDAEVRWQKRHLNKLMMELFKED